MAKGIQHLLRLPSNRFLVSIQRFSFFIKEKAKTSKCNLYPGLFRFQSSYSTCSVRTKSQYFWLNIAQGRLCVKKYIYIHAVECRNMVSFRGFRYGAIWDSPWRIHKFSNWSEFLVLTSSSRWCFFNFQTIHHVNMFLKCYIHLFIVF